MCVPRFYVERGGDKYIYTTTSTNLIKIFFTKYIFHRNRLNPNTMRNIYVTLCSINPISHIVGVELVW